MKRNWLPILAVVLCPVGAMAVDFLATTAYGVRYLAQSSTPTNCVAAGRYCSYVDNSGVLQLAHITGITMDQASISSTGNIDGAAITASGGLSSDTLSALTGVGITYTGDAANTSTNSAHVFDNAISLTSTRKLAEFRNNTTPKFSIGSDGTPRLLDTSAKVTCDSTVAGTIKYEVSANVGTMYGCVQTGAATYAWAALH